MMLLFLMVPCLLWIIKPHFCVLFPGAIELAILSDFYGREIAAYDIQTKRCDVYGQVKRCIVMV